MKWNRILGSLAIGAMFWACSDNDNKDVAGGASGDAGIVAVKDLDVAGLAQKGPFVKGSAVSVQGIDCKTMEFTNEEFTGKVKSDKGDFGVDGVNLSASCALFEVSGYYLNEVTGKKSSDKLTLHAITDLSDRNSVNINVLTELEYERVMKLVSKEKMSFADAKKQAEKEVLASLGIMDLFESFEGMSIYEKGDGNSTLLATSVLLQSDLNAEELTDRMDAIASSITKTGEWNDEKTKTEIAEWAAAVVQTGKLDSIRANVEGMNDGEKVAAFEKYILAVAPDTAPESLSSSSKDIEPAEMSSSSSAKSSSSYSAGWSWDVPKETRLNPNIKYDSIIDPRDKQVYKVVKIEVPDSNYSQVWMAENLNYADSVKTPSLKGNNWCYQGDEKKCKVSGRYYSWTAAIDSVALANDAEAPLDCGYGKKCGLDRAVQGICPDGWHLPSIYEWGLLSVALGNAPVSGEPLKALTGWNYAGTPDNNGTDLYGFAALPTGRRISATKWEKVGSDVYYWSATEYSANDGRYFNINNVYTNSYTYQNSKSYGQSVRCVKGDPSTAPVRPSSSSSVDETKSSSSVVSSSSSVVAMAKPCKTETEDNCEYGTLTDDRDGQTYKTVKIGKQWWMAENLNYASLQPSDSLDSTSFCYNDSLKYCEKYGRLYTWAAAVDSAGVFSSEGKGCGYYAQCTFTKHIRGVCPDGWHVPDTTEWQTLIAMVSGDYLTAGKLLKATSGWDELDGKESNGTDSFGFAALPVGAKSQDRLGDLVYVSLGSGTRIWAATDWNDDLSEYGNKVNGGLAYYYTFQYDALGHNLDYKLNAYPVRCIKD